MAESLYLEMPTRKKSASLLLRRLLPLWALLLLAVACLGWWWLNSGQVKSVWGMLDGMVYAVSPEFSGRLEEISVREGDLVRQGQPVARVDSGGYASRLREAGREVAGLRAMGQPLAGPPNMEETAARLKEAQEAEREMVRRLAQARHEEDARRMAREERVTEHVRAQLQLRAMDSQGGERAAGKARYAALRQAEAAARASMEKAKAEFEEVSRMRASLDQELGRVRDEMLRFRQMASRNRYGGAGGAFVAAAPAAPPVSMDGTLYAPVSGKVLRAAAQPGGAVQRGEPVLFILPEGQDAVESFWVLAYFPLRDGEKIRAGQTCEVRLGEVRLGADGRPLGGRVAEVLTPQPLPAGQSAAPSGQPEGAQVTGDALFVPARILLDNADPAVLTPGIAASCTVRTRTILGFSAF